MSKSNNPAKGAFISLLIVWIFYFYSYIARIEPSVLVHELTIDFGMTSSVIGFVISIMYIPYVVLQIPCGLITDKIGVKGVITASAALCALGTFLFGSAHEVLQLQIGRFLIGLSAASAFLCCGKIASDCFSPRKYSMLMGVAMCMGCLGGIAGTTPIAFLVSHMGWRNATFIIAAIGIVIAILALLTLPGAKTSPKTRAAALPSEQKNHGILRGLRIIGSNPRAWILGFYGAVTYLPLSAFAELWAIPFIEKKFGLPTAEASTASIVVFIGFALGGILSAWIAEKIGSYKKTIIFFTLGVVVAFSCAIYGEGISYFTCISLLFVGGILAGANTLAFTIAASLVPKEYSATSTGFLNSIVMSSGIIFQPLLGKLLDCFRDGLVDSNGLAVYTASMYQNAFFVIIIFMVLAIFATFFINDVKHSEV